MTGFWSRLKTRLTTLSPAMVTDHWHNILMLLTGVLAVVGFTIGWHHPDRLSAFADAISKLPDQAWQIFAVILGIPTLRRILSSPDQ